MNKSILLTFFVITLSWTNIVNGQIQLPEHSIAKKNLIIKSNQVSLAPLYSISHYIKRNLTIDKPTLGIEALYIFPKHNNIKNFHTSARKLYIINVLHAISTMEGMQYYSQSKGKMGTLFEKSYIINNKTMERVPDPKISVLKPEYNFYALQKDNILGQNIYCYTITIYNEYIMFTVHNSTAITYGLLTLIDKEQFKLYGFIEEDNKNINIYLVYSINTRQLLIPIQKLTLSLQNRADAIALWIYKKLS
ncbi:MAG TPA: hypothetical protein PLH80_08635 [Spirochaetota bacterium]|nr:hypothetical protein [Spirochaetota bacterium]HPK45799.1 hypothetical protein [Spirochaetota bacterium]HQI38613.1 hypothetical protein [Spirochaetota bacterium]HQK07930.1 hypothetical protein [Spirochaetota bacterium]